jgi:hypothetical protein
MQRVFFILEKTKTLPIRRWTKQTAELAKPMHEKYAEGESIIRRDWKKEHNLPNARGMRGICREELTDEVRGGVARLLLHGLQEHHRLALVVVSKVVDAELLHVFLHEIDLAKGACFKS